MLFTFLENLSLDELRSFAKLCKMRKYSKLKKYNLKIYIMRHISASIIQKWWRRKRDLKDPISFEDIRYPCVIINVNGKNIFYNFDTIIPYWKNTFDFREPLTRHDMTLDEIKRIQTLCINNNIDYGKDIVINYKNRVAIKKYTDRRRDAYDTCEYYCGLYLLQLTSIIEHAYMYTDENDRVGDIVDRILDIIFNVILTISSYIRGSSRRRNVTENTYNYFVNYVNNIRTEVVEQTIIRGLVVFYLKRFLKNSQRLSIQTENDFTESESESNSE